MKVLIATKNKGKIGKFGTILKQLGIDYCTLYDLNIDIYVEEVGKTISENAIIKAKKYYEITKMPLIADDSGLYIDKLPKERQPGMYVRRYNNKVKDDTDEEMLQTFIKELEKVGGESEGVFYSSFAIIDANGVLHEKQFSSPRYFISNPCTERIENFPLRSLIYYKEVNKYMAQMTHEESQFYEGQVIQDEIAFIKEVFACTK